jgi:hypothetical protein
MLKRILRRIELDLSTQGPRFSPAANDVMLVSYPKSGNTWIRAMVAHLIEKHPSLGDMERLVPDVYKSNGRTLRNAHRFPYGGRLIKSHQSFRPDYKRVIYVTRDPRAVCISYYHYLRGVRRNPRISGMTLSEFVSAFIDGDVDPFGTWGEHVTTWACAEKADILHLRYEDISSSPEHALKAICTFLSLPLNQEAISYSVKECVIDNLRRKEAQNSGWSERKNATTESLFFRRGNPRSLDELHQPALDQIAQRWGSHMSRLRYTA